MRISLANHTTQNLKLELKKAQQFNNLKLYKITRTLLMISEGTTKKILPD